MQKQQSILEQRNTKVLPGQRIRCMWGLALLLLASGSIGNVSAASPVGGLSIDITGIVEVNGKCTIETNDTTIDFGKVEFSEIPSPVIAPQPRKALAKIECQGYTSGAMIEFCGKTVAALNGQKMLAVKNLPSLGIGFFINGQPVDVSSHCGDAPQKLDTTALPKLEVQLEQPVTGGADITAEAPIQASGELVISFP
ncbi:hypothetical protein [Enterobacter bugandensis]|uniref:hypothetical protein n=1 Tax=Enterobacter bugandensis TaxID=881260 RepID=UPI0006670E8A|nr:hypothetical protein [Enterobacter bugandensis]